MTRRLPVRETVNASYACFFRSPLAFLLVAAVPPAGFALTLYVVIDVLAEIMLDAGLGLALSAVLAGALILVAALYVVCMGALISGADSVRRGRPFSVSQALIVSLRRCPAMLATSLPILAIGVTGLFAARPFSSPAWLLLPLVLAVANVTILALAMPICLLERLGPLASHARSVTLTRGSRVRFFVAFFVVLLPVSVLTSSLRVLLPLGGLIGLLLAALHFAALSIQSVVALDMLAGAPAAALEAPDDLR